MRVGCWPTYEAMTKIAATILLYQKKMLLSILTMSFAIVKGKIQTLF
jgi:hypothetical protein